MTTTTMRSKVHQYIDEADSKVIEVVYQLLEVYRQNNTSMLSEAQQQEVLKRLALYKAGKIKGNSVAEARKQLKEKLSR
ncbi:MAG: hypothetical protein IT236_06745 [Bacteroidia bacterium]|nr:hypothetical protein [Bacteroidia bacterium]